MKARKVKHQKNRFPIGEIVRYFGVARWESYRHKKMMQRQQVCYPQFETEEIEQVYQLAIIIADNVQNDRYTILCNEQVLIVPFDHLARGPNNP